MSGKPGVGKSKFAEFIQSLYPGAVVCCADDLMVDKDGNYAFDPAKLVFNHHKTWEKFVKSLQDEEKVVIISNTNVSLHFREKFIDKARKMGYMTVSLAIEDLGFTNSHNVPDDKVKKMGSELKQNFRF